MPRLRLSRRLHDAKQPQPTSTSPRPRAGQHIRRLMQRCHQPDPVELAAIVVRLGYRTRRSNADRLRAVSAKLSSAPNPQIQVSNYACCASGIAACLSTGRVKPPDKAGSTSNSGLGRGAASQRAAPWAPAARSRKPTVRRIPDAKACAPAVPAAPLSCLLRWPAAVPRGIQLVSSKPFSTCLSSARSRGLSLPGALKCATSGANRPSNSRSSRLRWGLSLNRFEREVRATDAPDSM